MKRIAVLLLTAAGGPGLGDITLTFEVEAPGRCLFRKRVTADLRGTYFIIDERGATVESDYSRLTIFGVEQLDRANARTRYESPLDGLQPIGVARFRRQTAPGEDPVAEDLQPTSEFPSFAPGVVLAGDRCVVTPTRTAFSKRQYLRVACPSGRNGGRPRAVRVYQTVAGRYPLAQQNVAFFTAVSSPDGRKCDPGVSMVRINRFEGGVMGGQVNGIYEARVVKTQFQFRKAKSISEMFREGTVYTSDGAIIRDPAQADVYPPFLAMQVLRSISQSGSVIGQAEPDKTRHPIVAYRSLDNYSLPELSYEFFGHPVEPCERRPSTRAGCGPGLKSGVGVTSRPISRLGDS